MRLAGFVAMALWLGGPSAHAFTILPGQALVVPFTVSGSGLATANTLTFRLSSVAAGDATSLTVELCDGATCSAATRLASNVGIPVSGIAGFAHPGSAFTDTVVPANLASIQGGTIAGLIRVVPSFGGTDPLTADVSPFTSLIVGFATSSNQIDPTGVTVSLGPASVVPEPSVAVMLGISSALLMSCTRHGPVRSARERAGNGDGAHVAPLPAGR